MIENKAGLRLATKCKFPQRNNKKSQLQLVSNNEYIYTDEKIYTNTEVYGTEKEKFLRHLISAYNNSARQDSFKWSHTQASKDCGLSLKKIVEIKDFFVDRGLFKMNSMYLSYSIDTERLLAHDWTLCNILREKINEKFACDDLINETFLDFESKVVKYKELLSCARMLYTERRLKARRGDDMDPFS